MGRGRGKLPWGIALLLLWISRDVAWGYGEDRQSRTALVALAVDSGDLPSRLGWVRSSIIVGRGSTNRFGMLDRKGGSCKTDLR